MNGSFLSSRPNCMLVGAGFTLSIVALLSFGLDPGSTEALLLLDMSGEEQIFPYPFTIQNIMWALLGIGFGDIIFRQTWSQKEMLAASNQLLPEDEATIITPMEVHALRERVRKAIHYNPGYICTVVEQCLLYFQANRSVENTHQMMNSMIDLELHRVDLRYTLLRYLAWLIPTIGFIGTVVGIASALTYLQGGESMSDNMEAVINSLAMAFNTTILALCFSALLVMLIQFSQKREEDSINFCSDYCLRNLINRLYIPKEQKE